MGLIFGKVAKSCAGYAHAVEAVWGSLDHSLFANAIGRDLTCLNILGTGPSLPPKHKRVRRVLVQAGLPPTRFFKHPPFPAIGLLFLVVNEEEKWEESALCVAFATTVSYRTIVAVDSLKFDSQSCV